MQEKAPGSASQRRTTRLMIAVPITIGGKNTHGEAFREETRTIDISRQGASIITAQAIAPGSEIVVENPPLGLSVKACVTVFFEKAAHGGRNQIGVELLERKNVWGIQYPPADWRNVAPAAVNPPAELRTSPASLAKLAQQDLSTSSELPDASPDPKRSPAQPGPFATTTDRDSQNGAASRTESEAAPLPEVFDVELGGLHSPDVTAQPGLQNEIERRAEKGAPDLSLDGKPSNPATHAGNSSTTLERLLSRVGEAQKETQLFLRSTLEGFPEQLQQAAQTFRETILSNLAQECIARAAMDVEAEQSKAEEQVKKRISFLTHSVLEGFQAQLQHAAHGFVETTLSGAAQESAARFTGELQAKQDDAVKQAEDQIHRAEQLALERFQGQLQQAAHGFVETTLSGATQECAARFTGELQAKQDDAVKQAEDQIHRAEQLALERFQGQLQQAAHGFVETTLSGATQECAARFTGELQAKQDDAVKQAENRMHSAECSVLEGFQAQLQQAAQNFAETTLSGAAQECAARFTGELQAKQDDAVREAENRIHDAEQLALESFRGQLGHSVRLFGESIERFLQASSCQISKSAQDILVTAHEELAKLCRDVGDEARN